MKEATKIVVNEGHGLNPGATAFLLARRRFYYLRRQIGSVCGSLRFS